MFQHKQLYELLDGEYEVEGASKGDLQ